MEGGLFFLSVTVEYNVIFIYERLSLNSQTKYYSKRKEMVL